ncbi:lysozyme inhibitor LprI family protein [Novosphingobium sp.]|uniref:lysozyme inhibitor LprI family protein n=1 Tax=Novosphingobium sp. TaxID=1874826 RepID=UPI003B52EF91
MKQIVIVAACATLAAAVPANAQSAGAFMKNPAFQDPPPAQCISTFDLQHCAAHDLRVADAQMTTRYNGLRATLPTAARTALLAEQRAWLRSRDRDCLAKGRGGGTIAGVNVAQCWVDTTKLRSNVLADRARQPSAGATIYTASAFVGRWRGGEGTTMTITRRGQNFVIDNQWGLDANMHGTFTGTLTRSGLRFVRNSIVETARPSRGDAVNRSALRGKTDCLMVSRDEGYCRY